MTSAKSMTDIAYEIMSTKKRAVAFSKLWEDVSKVVGCPKTMIGKFYTDLSLDSRFASLKDNKWDLKERRKFAESHVDISKIELDDDEEESEETEEDNRIPISQSEDEY